MSYPLKILFIWHHHQPYYKTDGTYLMPWVRMHGIKDYWDMVRMLDDYPKIKQTFNFAPSLLEQIEDYIENKTPDIAYLLSVRNPDSFTEQDKIDALKTFFLANTERMIKRYPRYAELLEKRGAVRSEQDLYAAISKFGPQDFRDLQVWWNLSWVGEYSRFDPPFKYYLDKQRNFSEEEKLQLLKAQFGILKKIVPHHIEALKRKQIEITVSPFYHPILPLLCDSDVATKANPKTTLPENRYKRPEDAKYQVQSALEYGKKLFGVRPKGMWPSEGSVSDDALKILIENQVAWAATDEAILQKTLTKSGSIPSGDFQEKYFAYNFTAKNKPIKMFFRDHSLSDLIGFVYSHWNPDDAAHDFVARLLKIKESLVLRYGEAILDTAVVPIILDGENAWEFYQSDGKDFLRTLYYLLTNESRLETVLPSDVKVKPRNSISHIEPGSWINGNFDIWIGHQEDNKAWEFLYKARQVFEKSSKKVSAKARNQAYKELLVAEGSDWCWWYGDEDKTSQANEFDELFRYHLKQVYTTLGLKAPAELDEPIKRKVERLNYRQPFQTISPKFDEGEAGKEWGKAGFVEHEEATGAMQKTGMLIKRIYFGNDRENLYLKIETSHKISTEKTVIEFFSPTRMSLEIGSEIVFRSEAGKGEQKYIVHYKIGETVQLAVSCPLNPSGGKMKSDEAALSVFIYSGNNLIDSLPQQSVVKFKLFQ